MSVEALKTDFLENQLELYKKEIASDNNKWSKKVDSYKSQYDELKKQLQDITTIFDDNDIVELNNSHEDIKIYREQSKNGNIEFFKLFENKEMISKYFSDDYFKDKIEMYKDKYIYDNLIKGQESYIKNLNISDELFDKYINSNNIECQGTNDRTMDSFRYVGQWKLIKNGDEDNKELKYNSGSYKGAMLQYLIIEYLCEKTDVSREKIIEFYDLSIKILLTPHSMKNAMGLHYNVNNNNFILELLDFYILIKSESKDKWKGYLNAKWPYEDGKPFNKFNTNALIELHSWIHLGENIGNGIISIYNNKTTKTLYSLMNEKSNINPSKFYELYKNYIDNKIPYPDTISTDIEKVLFADQFFQYISELTQKEFNLFKNIIYHGAPGTGKTYELKEEIKDYLAINGILGGKSEFIQFHSSYYYEDFIGGLKPTSGTSLLLEYKNGIFKQLCREAAKYEIAYYQQQGDNVEALTDQTILPNDIILQVDNTDFRIVSGQTVLSQFPPFFILIDEINRADLSKVFGELLYAIEDDYRGFENKFKLSNSYMETEETSIYSENGEHYFFVPKNLFIRGTMNDIDRSVDSIDFAFRRRFKWVEKKFEKHKIEDIINKRGHGIDDVSLANYLSRCKELNEKIVKDISIADEAHKIGHAIFSNIVKYIDNKSEISKEAKEKLFENHIESIIYNYLKMDYGNESSDIKAFKEVFTK